jgi:hypothetical protein
MAGTHWEDADQVSFTVLPQTSLGQSSIAPGQTDLHPGKKEKMSNKQ